MGDERANGGYRLGTLEGRVKALEDNYDDIRDDVKEIRSSQSRLTWGVVVLAFSATATLVAALVTIAANGALG